MNIIPSTDNTEEYLKQDDETAPVLIYHGLNGVYVKECKKWMCLDARGNKEGVDARFSLDEECLAFPVRNYRP